MRLVQIAADNFSGSGLTFVYTPGAPEATFTFPSVKDGVAGIAVSVRTDGTNLRFYPERSSAHCAVLAKLGVS